MTNRASTTEGNPLYPGGVADQQTDRASTTERVERCPTCKAYPPHMRPEVEAAHERVRRAAADLLEKLDEEEMHYSNELAAKADALEAYLKEVDALVEKQGEG